MSGTIPKSQLAADGYHFCQMPDGTTRAFKMGSTPIGSVQASFAVKWPWDDLYTPLSGFAMEGSDAAEVKEIMVSAGLWDASWQAYEVGSGGDYVSPATGQHFSGQGAISRRLQDYVIAHSTFDCESAVDTQWLHGVILPKLQGWSDLVFGPLVIPPAPPAPANPYPPQAVGQIGNALGLADAENTLLTGVAQGNRLIIGAVAVPH